MPYNDAKTRMTRAFSAQSGGNAQRPARPQTYALEVTGYDLANQTVIGKRVDAGFEDQILEVSINANTVAKQRERDKAKTAESKASSDAGSFSGAYIDEKMSNALPAGSILLVERGIRQKSVKVGTETRQVIEANWIHHLPDDNLDKLIDAPLAGLAYNGRLRQIQAYKGRKSHSVASDAGSDAISALADQMDKDVSEFQPEDYKPRVGVRFIAVRETDREKERYSVAEKKMVKVKVVEQIDSSFRYDWVDESEENATREERKGRPMGGNEMIESLEGYIEYIEGRFGKEGVHVEVRPYIVFFASKTDNSFDANPSGKNFVAKNMANTPMKLAQGEEEQYYAGGNYGVQGKLMLVKDKTHKGKIDHQYLAARIFLDGYHAPIDELIPTEDGSVVELIAELRPQLTERQQNTNAANGSAPEQGGGFASSLTASAEDDPFGGQGDAFGGEDGGDVYTKSFNTASAAPTSTEEPAAAPAPEQTSRSRLRR